MTTGRAPVVLFLGAAPFQVPPILYARECGYDVVTCDNRPDNPGHRLAHRTYNVSTADVGAVVEVAAKEGADGIVAFGSDLSARTASVAAEELGLPSVPASTVTILTDKGRFRTFLAEQGLQRTEFRCFGTTERAELAACLRTWSRPLMVKPVDGNGSKGVGVLRGNDETALVDRAFAASRSGQVIVEEFVARCGAQVCGDGWMDHSELSFVHFGDGHFDDSSESKVPYAETFPSRHDPGDLARVRAKLEEILQAVGYVNGPFNLDVLVRDDGAPFVVEIGPRSGGNFIPTAIHLSSGTDLVAATVEWALDAGFMLPPPALRADPVASYMIHAARDGHLREVEVSPLIRPKIVQHVPYVAVGEPVSAFTTADRALGNLLMRFDDPEEMAATIASMPDMVRVTVD